MVAAGGRRGSWKSFSSILLSVRASLFVFSYSSIYVSISLCLSVCSVFFSIRLYVCLCVHSSVCVSVCVLVVPSVPNCRTADLRPIIKTLTLSVLLTFRFDRWR